jgi:hypothetical protein
MRITAALLLLAFAGVSPIAAQTPSDTTRPAPKHPLTNSYTLVKRQLLAAADSMAADGYAARLTPEVRSFAEIIGHMVETNFGVCAGARKETNPKKGEKFDVVITSKSELVPLLRESFVYCDVPMNQLVPGTMGSSDATFLVSHTAQMVVLADLYLVSRGAAPPNSEVLRTKGR